MFRKARFSDLMAIATAPRTDITFSEEVVTAEPDSVLQVVQRGYELNGRLLRPARVIVASST